jgi:hypothetical protein
MVGGVLEGTALEWIDDVSGAVSIELRPIVIVHRFDGVARRRSDLTQTDFPRRFEKLTAVTILNKYPEHGR